MKIDLKSNTRTLRERLETETNPVLRRNIATVIRHIEGEIANRVDVTMSTMVSEPLIRSFFSSLGRFDPQSAQSSPAGESMAVRGGAAVRAMYEGVCGARLVWTQFDVDRLVVDTHCLVQDGLFYCPTPGAALKEMGRAVDDETALYLGIGRMVVIFPFDVQSGLLLGEDIFIGPDFFDGAETRKINLEEDYLPGYDKIVDLPPAGASMDVLP